jgi:hypothetical protein
LCWASDNNLTRKVSTNDATVIVCLKGLAAGVVNLGIAHCMGDRLPGAPHMLSAMATGFVGYGVSLVLFVIALRNLGTARTGAYFSVAPLTVLSPGEPHSTERPIRSLSLGDYQGRAWATRRHMWVDRVASAWLIRRFIDRDARFIWLTSPDACPTNALGFDFDGAAFTHIGERVTFEVLIASFGLDKDPALLRLGEIVHTLDVGGAPVPEAIGFEAVMAGARERATDDDQLLDEMGRVLDSLYTHFTSAARIRQPGGRS